MPSGRGSWTDFPTATGSRRRDLATGLAILLVSLALAPNLRVYYRVTVVDLTVEQVDPDGTRRPMRPPETVWGPAPRGRLARQEPARMLRTLERSIDRFMREDPAAAALRPGIRLEWIVRYSENSPRLDRRAVIVSGRPLHAGPDRRPSAARAARYLFAPVDPLVAAVFRLGLAAMLLLVFWPPGRGIPAEAMSELPVVARMYDLVFLRQPYWWATVCLLVAFGAGVGPRVTGLSLVALLLPMVPVPGRGPGRQTLLLTLVAFSFVRSDARLSLPRLLRQCEVHTAGPAWPIHLIRCQLALLYGVNAIAKAHVDYLTGDVLIGMSTMLPNFRVALSSGVVTLGPLSAPVWLAAVATVMIELALALGFWFRRLAVATAVLGILFHVVLAHVVRIAYLDVVAVFLYSAFLLPFDRRDEGRG